MIETLNRIRNGEAVSLTTSEGHKMAFEMVSEDCYRVTAPKLFKSKKFLTFEGVRNLLKRELPEEVPAVPVCMYKNCKLFGSVRGFVLARGADNVYTEEPVRACDKHSKKNGFIPYQDKSAIPRITVSVSTS